MSRKFLLITLVLLGQTVAFAQSSATQDDSHGRRLWMLSMAAVVGASSFDAGTSWGKLEGNPMLASNDGTFGVRGVSIKAALGAAMLVPQIAMRHHAEWRRRATIANFIEAGVYGGIAVHNTRVQ